MTLVAQVQDPTEGTAAPAATPPATPAPSAQAPDAGPQARPQAEAGTPAPGGEPDYRNLYESVEKDRIAPLMSEKDKAVGEATKLREQLGGLDDEWLGWVEFGAERGYTAKQLLDHIKQEQAKAQNAETVTAASRSTTATQINGLYRKGEVAFANYLQDLVDADPAVRITQDNVTRHRATFDRLSASGQQAAPAPAATTPATAPAKGPRTPPVVPGTGGAPQPGGEPVWRPGTRSRQLLDRALGAFGR